MPLPVGADAPRPIRWQHLGGMRIFLSEQFLLTDMLCTYVSGKELSHLFFLSVGMFGAVGGLSC